MLLASHIIVGAAVAASTPNIFLGLLLAFLSHFILDRIPHSEYSVEPLKQIKTRGIKYCMPILQRVALDFGAGYLVLFIVVAISKENIPFAAWALGGFLGALPDGMSFLLFLKQKNGLVSKFLNSFSALHQKIHFDKKTGLPPLRIGLSTQAIAVLLALYFLIF